MLWVIVNRGNRTPLRRMRAFRGGAFARRVRPLPLESIRRRRRLPAGGYLFVGHETWSSSDLALGARLARRMREEGAPVWNDPGHVLRRYALLRMLFEDGTNSFNVYRADERREPTRWPVFLRGEHDHQGHRSELLPDRAALAAALREVEDPASALIVEFVDTRGGDRLHSKCGACRVGDALFARHRIFGEHWMVKVQAHPEPACAERERSYVASFPDREAVASVFERAGIDYGRIDYTPVGDRIEVWEINTNPTIVDPPTLAMKSRWAFNEPIIHRHCDALLALAETGEGRSPVPLKGVAGVRPGWRWWGKR
ncbi:MAG: hypothetical protein AAGD14_07835 [Planctomycetota bacterium]